MKWSLLTMIGLGGVATASPGPGPTCTPGGLTISCPTKTINNIEATFDDLNVGSTIERPYHHLSYSNATVKDIGAGSQALGVIPHSKANYVLSGPYPNQYIYAPTLSITGTNTTSFDLHDLWVGCLSANNTKDGYSAVQCTVYVQCTTPSTPEGNWGPIFAEYTPNSATGAAMMNVVLPDFTYCTSAYFKITNSTPGPGSTIFVADSFNYTIRQGEVFAIED